MYLIPRAPANEAIFVDEITYSGPNSSVPLIDWSLIDWSVIDWSLSRVGCVTPKRGYPDNEFVVGDGPNQRSCILVLSAP